jgi:hypothetical protein
MRSFDVSQQQHCSSAIIGNLVNVYVLGTALISGSSKHVVANVVYLFLHEVSKRDVISSPRR